MRRLFHFHLTLFLLCPALSLAVPADIPIGNPHEADISVNRLQIPFVQNQGQVADEVGYYARTFGGTLFVTTDGRMILTIPSIGGEGAFNGFVREEMISGSPNSPKGLRPSPTRVSHIIGKDPAGWQTDLLTFDALDLGEVYEGINLRLEAYGNSVEKVFTVRPGADPSRIMVKAEGAEGLIVADDGTLKIRTSRGDVTYSAPVAFQEAEEGKESVQVAYAVQGDTYGFRLGSYDRERPLVIDPILNATYLGGSMNDQAYSMAFGEYGHIYVTGLTQSPDFPGIDVTSAQDLLNNTGSGTDVFIALIDATLGAIHQATYLGGTLWDEPGYGSGGGPTIAVHPINGKVYVTGFTQSANFPAMSAGYDSTIGGGSGDAFVARLDPDLTTVEVASYFGGGSMDLGTALTVDPLNGDIYITGRTQSAGLPETTGNYDSTMNGTWDGFVALFSPDLDVLRDATYIGGSGIDWPFGMTTPTDELHPGYGSVYVTGQTFGGDFPPAAGGAQETSGGSDDAFVVRLWGPLSQGQGTYLGGEGGETGFGVQVHPDSGDLFVCGTTSSADFPNVSGGAQAAHAGTGYNDAFVAILSPDLGTLGQSTYLGGRYSENNSSILIDPGSGDIYLAGTTYSDDFPGTAEGAQPDSAGDDDVFAARLSEDLTTLYQSTYVGGSSRDMGFAIGSMAVSNGVYITGLTWSGDFPGMSDTFSAQPTHGGTHYINGKDAFVVWLDSTLLADPSEPDINVFPLSLDFGTIAVGDTRSLPVIIGNDGNGELVIDLIQFEDGTAFTGDITRPYQTADACSDYAVSSTEIALQWNEYCAVHVIFSPLAEAAYSDTLSIGSNDPDEDPVEIPLDGAGGSGPDIDSWPDSLDFGPVPVGTWDWREINILNRGDSPLVVYDIILSDSDNFSVDIDTDYGFSGGLGTCSSFYSTEGLFELGPDEGCNFAVIFNPEDHGILEETLEIRSNDPNHPSVFATLTGGTDIGLVGVYVNGDTDPLYYDFGYLWLGMDPVGTFRVTNYGAVSYSVMEISIEESDSFPVAAYVVTGQAGLCPTPPFALEQDESCDFNVALSLYDSGSFEKYVILDLVPGGIEIRGYFDGVSQREKSPPGECSISEPGGKTGPVHVILLTVFVGGLWTWRRKRFH